jgi:lysophospholipase L1-like esterase
MARLLTEDFENGSLLTNWNVSGLNVSISSTQVHGGTYASYFNVPENTVSRLSSKTVLSKDDVYIRAYVYITGYPSSGTTAIFCGYLVSGSFWAIRLNSTGTLDLLTNNTLRATTTGTIPLNTWTMVQFRIYCNGASTVNELILGNETLTDNTNITVSKFNGLRIGGTGSGKAHSYYVDDVAINDATGASDITYPGGVGTTITISGLVSNETFPSITVVGGLSSTYKTIGGSASVLNTVTRVTTGTARIQTPYTKIMPIGDSITELDWEGGYRSFLYNLLTVSGLEFDYVGRNTLNHNDGNLGFDFPEAYWEHEGYGGATIVANSSHIWNSILSTALNANPPGIVLLMLGTNDAASGTMTASGIRDAMSDLINDIWAFNPDIKIILSNIIRMVPGTLYNASTLSIIEAADTLWPAMVTEKVATGNYITMVDNYSALNETTDFTGDGVHPSVAGYTKMAPVWFPAVVDALNGIPPARTLYPLSITTSETMGAITQAFTIGASGFVVSYDTPDDPFMGSTVCVSGILGGELFGDISLSQQAGTPSKTVVGIARVTNISIQGQSGLTRICVELVKTSTGISRITAGMQRTVAGIARIRKTVLNTSSGVTRISNTAVKPITGVGRIQFGNTKLITGKTRITINTIKSVTSNSRVTVTTLKTIGGYSLVLQEGTSLKIHLGIAAIQKTTERVIGGISRIQQIIESVVTGVTRVTRIRNIAILGVGNIRNTELTELSGKVRISVTTTNNQNGVACLVHAVQQTVLGAARIQCFSSVANNGVARIQIQSEQVQLGKTRIVVNVWVSKEIIGAARISLITLKTTVGKAHIQVPDKHISGKAMVFNYAQKPIDYNEEKVACFPVFQ